MVDMSKEFYTMILEREREKERKGEKEREMYFHTTKNNYNLFPLF